MGRSILNLPETSSGDNLIKVHYHKYASRHGLANSQSGVIWRTDTFTTTEDNATFIIKGQIWARHHASDHCGVFCQLLDSSNNNVVSGADSNDGARYQGIGYAGVNAPNSWAKFILYWHQIYTGIDAGTYKVLIGWQAKNGGQERPFTDWNINSSDDGRAHQHESHCEIWELKASQGLNNQNLGVGVW